MAFVSHAGNLEDVMLWRALQGVERGFYVDVGATDPRSPSVTAAFYERGWQGIDVASDPAAAERLRAARGRDVVLTTAAPVATTLATHARGPIHFLRIAAGGDEQAVLEGAELARWAPWVLVVAGAHPAVPGWDELVRGAGYRFAYADGLNRFYVAKAQPGLAAAFAVPPHPGDGFVRAEEHALRERLARLEDADIRARSAETRLVAAEQEARFTALALARTTERAAALEAERDHAVQEMWESNRLVAILAGDRQTLIDASHAAARPTPSAELDAVLTSTSWRITAPLRALARLAGRP